MWKEWKVTILFYTKNKIYVEKIRGNNVYDERIIFGRNLGI